MAFFVATSPEGRMAKKPDFTLAEKQKAVSLIKKGLLGRAMLRGFNGLTAEDQLAAAEKFMRRHLKRDKFGAPDWESFFAALQKFLAFLFEILGPLLLKKRNG